MKFFHFLILATIFMTAYGAANEEEFLSPMRKLAFREALSSRRTQFCVFSNLIEETITGLEEETTDETLEGEEQTTEEETTEGKKQPSSEEEIPAPNKEEEKPAPNKEEEKPAPNKEEEIKLSLMMKIKSEGSKVQQCGLHTVNIVITKPPLTAEEKEMVSNFLRAEYRKFSAEKKPLNKKIEEYKNDVYLWFS